MIMIIENIIINNKDKVFAIDPYMDVNYTYYDIYNLSMSYSKIFSKRYSIKSNNRVILLLDNSIEFISLYFWAFFNDIIILPLSKKLPKKDIEKIIIDYSIDFIITDNNLMNTNKVINIKDMNIIKKDYDLSIMPKINYDKNLLLMYTSGTTGEPKCIVHSLSSFIDNGNKFIEFHNITSSDRFIQLLEMSYMAGYYNMFLVPFLAQSSVVIKQSFKPQDILRFWNEIIQYEVNILWFVPTIIKLLNKLDRSPNGKEYCEKNIKYIFSCTAPLDIKDKIDFKNKYNKKIFNTYGLSETLFISSENKDNYQEISNYIGQPIMNISIINKEICICDNKIFKGYLNPKQNLIDDIDFKVFYTRDLGEIKNGLLYITGRKKDIIIKGGVNINPKILEDKIKTLDFIIDVAVVGIKDKIFGEKAVAVIVTQNDNEIDFMSKLKLFSKDNFSSDIQIDDFIIFESLPLNRNNKVDKKKIVRIVEEGEFYNAPTN
ncbi:acyl--CoA ligase [Candidatus Woesearchaeota archaeon]|jgi:long-chain acyl-CoA synthetase|nr:acyl--CoA ligase [Candidatus Woesearchaeota archaeon]